MCFVVRLKPPSAPALFAAALCAALWAAAPAAYAQEFVGARALSLSEAYRANATGNDAIYLNPAGLPVIPRYGIEGDYQMYLAEQNHTGALSVVDSKTSPLAVGLGYVFDGRGRRGYSLEQKATLALAYPVLDRFLSLGLGLKYVNAIDAVVGNYLNVGTIDGGVLSRLPFGVSLAAVGYNLIPVRSARVPISAGFAVNWDLGPASALIFGASPTFGPVQTAAGLPVIPGDVLGPLSGLTAEFDWHVNFVTLHGTKSRLSTGLEYLAFETVPLRAGYIFEELEDDHKVSVGAGFIIPYFGLDVGYQQSVIHLNQQTLAITLKLFLNP